MNDTVGHTNIQQAYRAYLPVSAIISELFTIEQFSAKEKSPKDRKTNARNSILIFF